MVPETGGRRAVRRPAEEHSGEEEELILEDGTTDGATELICRNAGDDYRGAGGTVDCGLTRGAEAELNCLLTLRERAAPRAKVVFKSRAVEGVGASLGDVVDDRAGIAAILRAVVVRNDVEFLQRVLVAEEELWTGDGVVIVRLAVNLEVVGAAALSVGGEADAIGVGEVIAEGTHDAGNQQGETIQSAAGGQIGDRRGIEGGGNLRLSGLKQILRGADLDLLCACCRP